MLTAGADPVRKVSIVPRSRALGVALSAPEADRFSYPRSYLMAKLAVALGGRVAEELVYDDITAGAEEDIRQITQLARNMVVRSGMSDAIGPIAVTAPKRPHRPLARRRDLARNVAPRRPRGPPDRRRGPSGGHRAADPAPRRAHRLAHDLLDHETLDERDAKAAAGIAEQVPIIPGEPTTQRTRRSPSAVAGS